MLGGTTCTRNHDDDTTTRLERNTKGVVGLKSSVVADSASSGSSDGNSNIGDNNATKEELTKIVHDAEGGYIGNGNHDQNNTKKR